MNKYYQKSDFFQKPHQYNLSDKNNINFNNNKKPHIYSAGILPYQIGENGKIYFLLGKDTQGTWSDFGGKCEFQDKNNIKETASREFFEESLNSIIDLNTTREMLKNEKNYTLINSRTVSGSPYYMFILRVPMLPDTSRDRFKRTLQYLQYTNANYSYLEKTDVKWVSLDTILHCLIDTKYEEELGWPLRKVFRKTLVNNKKIFNELKNKLN
jgi:hypothetical protein